MPHPFLFLAPPHELSSPKREGEREGEGKGDLEEAIERVGESRGDPEDVVDNFVLPEENPLDVSEMLSAMAVEDTEGGGGSEGGGRSEEVVRRFVSLPSVEGFDPDIGEEVGRTRGLRDAVSDFLDGQRGED